MEPTLPLIPVITTTTATTEEPVPELSIVQVQEPEPESDSEPSTPGTVRELVVVEPLAAVLTPEPAPVPPPVSPPEVVAKVDAEVALGAEARVEVAEPASPYANLEGVGLPAEDMYMNMGVVGVPLTGVGLDIDEEFRRASVVMLDDDVREHPLGVNEKVRSRRAFRERGEHFIQKVRVLYSSSDSPVHVNENFDSNHIHCSPMNTESCGGTSSVAQLVIEARGEIRCSY